MARCHDAVGHMKVPQLMRSPSLPSEALPLTIYYDGLCPLCLAEVHFLKQHNNSGLLQFSCLQDESMTSGIDCKLAMQTIHAKLGEHSLLVGPAVFFEAYKRTDLRWVNVLFSFALMRFVYAKAYVFFAKYRHQISKVIGPYLLKRVKARYPLATKADPDQHS
jgi:predicted DCC family thiol-disulfide oxidoreductase YuxK